LTIRRAASLACAAAVAAGAAAACNGTAGGALVRFTAFAAGPADATSPLTFAELPAPGSSASPFSITLTSASMHIGAVYVTQAAPSAPQGTSCIEESTYVAQVPGPVDVDLLSPSPQEFTVFGDGTDLPGQTGEIWLTHGDVTAPADPTPVICLSGVATNGNDVIPFFGAITIGLNRQSPVSDPSQPGLSPLCQQRILKIAPIQFELFQGGTMTVRADPRAWFTASYVDFSRLPAAPLTIDPNANFSCGKGCASQCPPPPAGTTLRQIPDTMDTATQGAAFFGGIRHPAANGYSISFQ
jgi:hypothetical protein